MLFQPEHIDKTRLGKKTETRRIWKSWHAKVGGVYPMQTKMYQPRVECPLIKCTNRYMQPLGEMTEENAKAEGGYTLEEYKAVWERINLIPWDDSMVVYVVVYKYFGEGRDGA